MELGFQTLCPHVTGLQELIVYGAAVILERQSVNRKLTVGFVSIRCKCSPSQLNMVTCTEESSLNGWYRNSLLEIAIRSNPGFERPKTMVEASDAIAGTGPLVDTATSVILRPKRIPMDSSLR